MAVCSISLYSSDVPGASLSAPIELASTRTRARLEAVARRLTSPPDASAAPASDLARSESVVVARAMVGALCTCTGPWLLQIKSIPAR